MRKLHYLGVLLLICPGCGGRERSEVLIGSKRFPESVILGELVQHLCTAVGVEAIHREGLGDTSKTWEGLLVGELDVYVEYTGTLMQEILEKENLQSLGELEESLARRGLLMSKSLGFRNNYALGMLESRADELKIDSISDLVSHLSLKLGLSHAFIERGDGWHGLKQRYQLPFATPRGMEHSLAYQGLANGSLDVIDVYTTDGEIREYNVRVLKDDREYFPAYEAVLLYRADLEKKSPEALASILRLQGAIDESRMQEMNRLVQSKGASLPETVVAARFLAERLNVHVEARPEGTAERLWRMTREHLVLVAVSLLLAIVTAVPLGIVATRHPILEQVILSLIGMVQTFPALALLSVLIVLLQRIGTVPAILALYAYSLLPIVRNTCVGMTDVPLSLRESAEALGLSPWARLRLIELPMASRSILAGIKTAAVINVGFATLGGLIGAGGYGQAIMSGLDKNDYRLVLTGAVPAVLMALVVQGLFELAERRLVPRGLRLKPAE